MTDKAADVWTRNEIESPCLRVCVIQDASGLCVGCYRSRPEIAGWSRMTPEERRTIMAELPNRRSLLTKRRGGRARTLNGIKQL